ncbi:MAG: helix-turn-helix domain-containing protein [Promethearchaeota archaeon]
MEKYNINEIKNMNLNQLQFDLVKVLQKNGPMTRTQMVATINRARTTIYDNLSVLINRNMVKKISRQVNKRGRPVIFFKLKEK